VRKHHSLVLQNQGYPLACQSPLLPAPVARPVPLLLAAAWLGRFPAAALSAAKVLLSARMSLVSKKLRASR